PPLFAVERRGGMGITDLAPSIDVVQQATASPRGSRSTCRDSCSGACGRGAGPAAHELASGAAGHNDSDDARLDVSLGVDVSDDRHPLDGASMSIEQADADDGVAGEARESLEGDLRMPFICAVD